MKRFIFLLIVVFTQASTETCAQQVTLSAKNAPLETVFKSIKDQTGFLFFYKTNLIEKGHKVNIQVINYPLLDALKIIFNSQPFDYSIQGKIIIIKPLKGVEETAGIDSNAITTANGVELTGMVKGSGGEVVAGASILVKGSGNGTTTDESGKFKILISKGDWLVFSSIGYKSLEIQITDQTVLNVNMKEEAGIMNDVVVTAFGIEKFSKALGYSTTTVEGEDMTRSRSTNLGSALSGKVAGVNVTPTASGPAGSSRVVIRGNTSITGNNQPLYVVNGIPMDNSTLGSAGRFGGKDWGDGLISINPDDIESVTVLKGSNASALYGSRASSGVILITTKQAKYNQGIGLEYNSNFVVDKVIDTYNFQKIYGHGRFNRKPETAAEGRGWGDYSFGGRLDGSMVYRYDGKLAPYSYTGSKVKQFYAPGSTFSNTISFSGGDATKNFRVSMADLNNNSIIPNSGLNRKNLTISTNGKFKHLTLSTTMLYSNEKVKNRPNLSDAPSNLNFTVAILPASINIKDLRGNYPKIGADENGNEFQLTGDSYIQNPYWTAYQNETKDQKDRIIASGKMRYDFTDWFFIDVLAGTDWYTSRRRDLTPYGTASLFTGALTELEIRQRETNAQVEFGINKSVGQLAFSFLGGGQRMRKSYEVLGNSGVDFRIPYFHTITNLKTVSPVFSQSNIGINSLFGSAELAFWQYVFLTITGRNDWFSTLSRGSNSVFYPSTGLSFVFSDAFQMPDWISFGKIRTSWAQVGGGGEIPYRTSLTYTLSTEEHLGASLAGITQTQVPNTRLQPLRLTEYELGFDLRLFRQRLGIDLAVYSRKTENDILDALVSNGTGFIGATLNIGKMTNKGIELLVYGTPIQGPFKWDISVNFAHNDNKVVQLGNGISILTTEQARTGRAWIQNRVGEAFSSIAGYRQKTINGEKVWDAEGFPVRDNKIVLLGKGVAPITGGLTNEFFFKNFDCSFLLDYRRGGSIYSGTNAIMYNNGVHANSVYGREKPMVVSGVDENGVKQSVSVDPLLMEDWYWRKGFYVSENVVYSGDYIKLRQFSLGYTITGKNPRKWKLKSLTVSVVARNLWLIYSGIENVDPESAYSNTNSQGLELAGVPNSRSIGMNLKIKF